MKAELDETALTSVSESSRQGYAVQGVKHILTCLPTRTLFVVDLTIQHVGTRDGPEFKRVLTTSVIAVLDLVNDDDTKAFCITALRERTRDESNEVVQGVAKIEASPPSVVVLTLDDGEQYVVLDDGEPLRMTTCIGPETN